MDFQRWLKQYGNFVQEVIGQDEPVSISQLLSYFKSERAYITSRNLFAVYRGMAVSEKYLRDVTAYPAGRFFSESEAVAREFTRAHTTKYDVVDPSLVGTIPVVLKAIVKRSQIDMGGTIAARLASSYEGEILLKRGEHVHLLQIEVNGHVTAVDDLVTV